MRKILYSLLCVLALSCQTEQISNVKPTNVKQITDPLTSELNDDDQILVNLKQSEAWTNIGSDLISRLDQSRNATLSSFENTSVQVISFSLKTSDSFESLVFYTDGTSFFPAIAKSKIVGDLDYLALTDLKGKPYYDFYANSEHKMGRFKVHKDFKLAGFQDAVRDRSQLGKKEPTCMDKTDSFGDCMLCGINECADDWVCAVTCTVMSGSCLAGFAIGCAVF